MNARILSVLFLGISKESYYILKNIQKEGFLSLAIACIAYDEKKAEQYVIEKKPDLIILEITDSFLVWNFMDEVRKEYQPEILLVSREKRFEHAYQALQHHALNLLLEPIDKNVVLHCLEEVNRKKQFIDEIKKDRKKLDLYELKKHQDLMERIITNMLDKPKELEILLGEVNQRYHIQLQNDYFQAIVINVDRQELYSKKSGFCQKILNLIDSSFTKVHEALGAVIKPFGITGIVNFSSENGLERMEQDVYTLYQNILGLQTNYGEFQVAIGVGMPVTSMKEINFSLQEALRAQQYCFVIKGERIFYASKIMEEKKSLDDVISLTLKKTLFRYLKNMEEEKLKEWFSQIIEIVDCEFKKLPEGYLLLKNLIIQIARQAWEEKIDNTYFVEEEDNFNKLDYIFDGKIILERLKESILRVCEKRKQSYHSDISIPIQETLNYMSKHYNEAITLEELADLCALSPNYFSALFKEQVRETYIEYLTELRLEKATQMLIQTKKTIKEISKDVGYLDDKYFRKLFKKRYGVTPSAYRLGGL